MIPSRGNLLARPVETESSRGGIELLADTIRDWTAGQYEVLSLGLPEWCEDPECELPHAGPVHPADPRLIPGAWILVHPRHVVGVEEDTMVLIRQADVVAVIALEPTSPPAWTDSALPPRRLANTTP